MSTIYFYGPKEDNYILSNFYPYAPGRKSKSLGIMYQGKAYPTSEHLYHALKFMNGTKDEQEWREHIRNAKTPTMAIRDEKNNKN